MELLHHVQAGGVDAHDLAHPEDADFRGFADDVHRILELGGGPEKEGAADFEHLHAFRDGPGDDGVRIIRIILVFQFARDDSDVGHAGHALHEEDHR